jgi:hypothetical protein
MRAGAEGLGAGAEGLGAGAAGLDAITPREASIFACVCDTVIAPAPPLPPVGATDAAIFFDRWLARSPRVNRLATRALLYAAELSPRALGFRGRLRSLTPNERARVLEAVERVGHPGLRELVRLLEAVASLSYYGNDAVMRRVGYDPDANVSRARELRAREGRP